VLSARCWLARLSLVLAAAAVVIVPVFAGLKSLAMLAIGLAAVAVSIVAGYLFLARRRLVRWLSLAVFALTPAAARKQPVRQRGYRRAGSAGAAGWRRARRGSGHRQQYPVGRPPAPRQAGGRSERAGGEGGHGDRRRAVIPVGIDGEAVPMQTPVTCTIRPGALRVRVPRDRPGATPPQPPLTWPGLWQLATGRNGGLR
jgi:hypothetical protein